MCKNIGECWEAIDKLLEQKSVTEEMLTTLLVSFPIWSGIWSWHIRENKDNTKDIVIENDYDEYGEMVTDSAAYELPSNFEEE